MGSRQLGNYRILDYIGSGGFGSVFKAEDITTPGRIAAVKELHRKHTRNSVIKQRFFQEALAMARLDHPNLPRLYTFGEDNGSYYLVMEFISGKLLSDEIQESGPLQPDRAILLITQVLEAVSYAHRNGIIHRDLKPDNIMITGDLAAGGVKVLDFGIARIIGGENLTLTGEGFGTPAYMSPERIAGDSKLDLRADLYSVGIIFFEMLVGRVPFKSTSTDPAVYWAEMSRLHASQPIPSLTAFGIPASLEAVTKKATAKTPAERYESADQMLRDLRALTGQEPGAAFGAQPARLAVTTSPADAEVYIDDVMRGASSKPTGKLIVEGLTPGLHSVRVSKGGYNDYRINVLLDEGRQTDLQVALAARSTMVMAPPPETGPVNAGTNKMESGDAVATALLVIDSLPAGTTLYHRSRAVAQADEDGRATIRLEPGIHEIEVAAPSGVVRKEVVTVSDKDKGSLKNLTLPLLRRPDAITSPPPAALKSEGAGKKVALFAAIALLITVFTTFYFVIRGPARPEPPREQSAAVAAETAPPPLTNANSAAAVVQAADKEADGAVKAGLAQEKKEVEKKASVDAVSSVAAKPEAPSQPSEPASNPAATPPANACVEVQVIGPDDLPLPNLPLVLIEEPGSGNDTAHSGKTDPGGQWRLCGLTPGKRVRLVIFAFGGRGKKPLAVREAVLSAGRSGVTVRVDPRPEAGPAMRPKRVPPFMRRPQTS